MIWIFFLFKVALEILGLGNTLIQIKGNFVLNVLIICSMSPRARAGVDCAMSPRAQLHFLRRLGSDNLG